jgi:hypothetical protein
MTRKANSTSERAAKHGHDARKKDGSSGRASAASGSTQDGKKSGRSTKHWRPYPDCPTCDLWNQVLQMSRRIVVLEGKLARQRKERSP